MTEEMKNCSYCSEGALLDAFGIKIGELPMSKVILFKEQSHRGRVIVACKKHVDDITMLTAEERVQYMEDVNPSGQDQLRRLRRYHAPPAFPSGAEV